MAIIRPSSIVAAISGPIGGVTFVNGPAGLVARHRPQPKQTHTEKVLAQRAAFQSTTQSWQRLEDDERAAWRSAAAGFPRTNRLGVTSSRNGYSLFVTVNLNRLRIGQPISATVPKNILGTSEETHEITMKLSTYSITITPSGTPKTNTFILIQGTRHFSKTLPKFANHLREIHTQILLALSPTTINFTTQWQAIFGAMHLDEAFTIRIIFYNHLVNTLHQAAIDEPGTVQPD